MKSMTRRTFFSSLTTGIAGMLFGSCGKQTQPADEITQAPAAGQHDLKIRQYNPLGKTGIKTSDITFGATAINTPNVIRYAFDLGVNVFDTAANYGGGVSEEIIGQGLKGVRDKAYIITKQYFPSRRSITKERITRTFEASLKKLQTDYVDVLFIHTMETMTLMNNDVIRGTYGQLKKEGKVRFTGFSTHSERITLPGCVQPEYEDFVDVVMFQYNHMEGRRLEPFIANMRQKGIGTIAMKTLAGGKQGNLKELVNNRLSYPQAAIAWVLANKNIDCAVMSMNNFSLVENYVGASGKKLEPTDLALLQTYRDAVSNSYCRVTCNSCEGSCPHKVAISHVMRCAMYYQDYGQQKKAIDHYTVLPNTDKPIFCQSCHGYCTNACPYGLPVKDQLLKTHRLLTG
jgi:predicted aldo/keto reductase-like oxidoreductase